MNKINIIKTISSILISILLLVMLFTGYPALWFVKYQYADLSNKTLPFIVNDLIIIIIVTIFYFVFKFFNKSIFKAFLKYIVIAAILFVVALGANVIGRYSNLSYSPTKELVFLEGILEPFLNNFTVVYIFTALMLNGLLLIPIKRFKNTIISSIVFVIYLVFVICFNIKMRNLVIFYQSCLAFGITYFISYILIHDEDAITPAVYYGICGISILPICYATHTVTPNGVIFVVGIMYIILGSIYLGMFIREDLKPKEAE